MLPDGDVRVPKDCCPVCTKDLESDGWCFECRTYPRRSSAATVEEKLVRDVYTYLPHRVAAPGERYGLLAAKFDEEVAEVKAAPIGSQEFIEELGDLIDVCYAIGGEERVEAARLAKWAERGGFDKLLVMRLEDRTDK